MAEVIGIASGLLALAGFGVQSCQLLIQTLQSFQSSKKTVRELKVELESLVTVLKSIQEACRESDAGFPALKLPVLECGKACKEFHAYLTKIAPRSDQDRRSFRDWANVTLRGDSIGAFKDKLAANKSTMIIALADANLRSTKVTADLVVEYQKLIKTTISDLEDRLEIINGKLKAPLPIPSSSRNDADERKRILEEIESTRQCLDICTTVSKHIDGIRSSIFTATSTPLSTVDQSFVANVGAISANFTTKQALESCNKTLDHHMQQLQSHLQGMSRRLESFLSSQGTDAERDSERERILEDFSSTKQSLDICLGASERASKDRLNVYTDVSVAEDSSQYIISTIGDLISATNISAGARSIQCMGQLSDESLQMAISSPRQLVAESGEAQTQPGAKFERYGPGFKLNT